MEQSFPPIDHDRRPEAETPKPKPRWNIFELFGPKPATESPETKLDLKKSETEPRSERKSEAQAEARPKRFGEQLLAMLGMGRNNRAESKEQGEPENQTPAPERQENTTPERQTSVVDKVVEGARSIGNGVLRLLGQTRENVMAADAKEPHAPPTDIEPLAKAEDKVETAVDDLNKAIESVSSGDSSGGGGGDFETPTWQLRAQQEAAALNTQREVDRAVEAERRRQERRNRIHQTGALAVVASLIVGGEAYTWHKLRKMRKEQELAARRDFEQQTEILEKTRKIEELERRQVSTMDRTQRQEYVHEVSAYATSQAENIAETAHQVRDRLAERPELHPANWPVERPAPVRTPEKPAVPEKPKNLVERAGELFASAKTQLITSGGGLAGGASRLLGTLKATVARQPDSQQKAAAKQYAPHDTVQNWLNGILLLLGILLIIAVLFAIY